MPIDGATYLAQMSETLPNNTDPRSEGAGQIRAVKRVLKNTFPNIDSPVTIEPELLNILHQHLFVRGMMMQWTGPITQIPENWTFCDGTPVRLAEGGIYTPPDLTDKFTKCASYTTNGVAIEDVGAEGGDHNGVASHFHPHTHSRGTMNITGAIYQMGEGFQDSGEADGAFTKIEGANGNSYEHQDTSKSGAVSFNAANAWEGSTSQPEDVTPVGTEGGNQPAYVVTAFIVYVGPHEQL